MRRDVNNLGKQRTETPGISCESANPPLASQESTKDSVDRHKIHWLWKETYSRCMRLHKRVCEGKFVDEASEFARWVRFSGLLDVFELHKAPEPFEVDRAKVEKLIVDTLFECEQFWKRNPRGPYVAMSELEAVNHKLDVLAARIAQIPVAVESGLRVLPDVVPPTAEAAI